MAQGQLVTEENISAAILEREVFLAIEKNALDLNRDGIVDVADLAYFAIINSNLVPSVSFRTNATKVFEDAGQIQIDLVLNQPADGPLTIRYTAGGTATLGPKAGGGDYSIEGYNTAASEGTVAIPAGATSASITLTVHDDGIFKEGMETATFMLTGGGVASYFLGSRQLHTLSLDDNDTVWSVGIVMPNGDGYESFQMEIVQEESVFDGRVLSDTKLIPFPKIGDQQAAGDDGWDARFFTSNGSLRVEIGPLPFDRSLSLFDVERTLSFVLEVGPSVGDYVFQPNREFSGLATTTLTPVKTRLGATDQRHIYLRRESTGTLTMQRMASDVMTEELVLTDAE